MPLVIHIVRVLVSVWAGGLLEEFSFINKYRILGIKV